jgi:hypothetical protein
VEGVEEMVEEGVEEAVEEGVVDANEQIACMKILSH